MQNEPKLNDMYHKLFKVINGERVVFDQSDPEYNGLSANIFHFLEGDLKSKENDIDWIEVTKNKTLIAYFKNGTTHKFK
jgi:hypothetical protein